jgi:hypothetical protein
MRLKEAEEKSRQDKEKQLVKDRLMVTDIKASIIRSSSPATFSTSSRSNQVDPRVKKSSVVSNETCAIKSSRDYEVFKLLFFFK